jgi:probable LLM family oxidoreductase
MVLYLKGTDDLLFCTKIQHLELGLYTFADTIPDATAGNAVNTHQRFKNLLEEIKLADELGLDVFGVGEHHRPEYAVSSPAVVLAAAATITKKIKLASAVTVLSSEDEDPVRVFQQFSTLDHVSDGRAEIMAGRGSFIESFPLFGYNLEDYNELFEEKLKMLLRINEQTKLTWKGRFTPAINDRGVYPRPFQEKLPVWIAAGGTPASAVRAAKLHLPLALAIIGGSPAHFVPFVELYRRTAKEHGMTEKDIRVGINCHVYIAEDSKKAAAEFYPSYAEMMGRIGRERGWPPLSREQFEHSRSANGALLVGSPEEITEKIMYEHQLFGNTRFLAQMSLGAMPHKKILKSMELFGEKVAPVLRKLLAEKKSDQKN